MSLKLRPRHCVTSSTCTPRIDLPSIHTDVIYRYVFTNSCFANLNSNFRRRGGEYGERALGGKYRSRELLNRTILFANYKLRGLLLAIRLNRLIFIYFHARVTNSIAITEALLAEVLSRRNLLWTFILSLIRSSNRILIIQ